MDNILYFTHYETEVQHFLDDLSQQMHIYGIPCMINYRNRTVETERYKIYAVSACSGIIGAFPGFKYYLNDAMEEEFNKRIRFKLLPGARKLISFENLIDFLKMFNS